MSGRNSERGRCSSTLERLICHQRMECSIPPAGSGLEVLSGGWLAPLTVTGTPLLRRLVAKRASCTPPNPVDGTYTRQTTAVAMERSANSQAS